MEFIYRKQNGDPSKRVSKSAMVEAAGRAMDQKKDGPFTLKKNEGDAGPERQRFEIMDALRRQGRHAKPGDTFRIRSERTGKVVFTTRAAQAPEKVIDTTGNDKIDKVWTAAKEEFKNISFLGAYVCKSIIGSGGTLSQHSYGNAVDIGAATMANLVDIAHWMVAHANELELEHVIVGNDIWTRGQGWHAYTGEYHYHVHVDCNPNQSGGCRQPN